MPASAVSAGCEIIKHLGGKASEVIAVVAQDAEDDFRIDPGIVVNDEVAEPGHFGHRSAHRFGKDAVFEKDFEQVLVVFRGPQ